MAARFGVFLNNRQPIVLGERYPALALVDTAVLAEDLGYVSVWVGDSPLAKPRLEPITTLAAVAARTKRVLLGTSILQPHLRNPMWLALAWATLDQISNGRTLLGVGLGAGRPALVDKEYLATGVDRKRRGKRFEESIELLRRLWTEEHVTAKGDGFLLNDVTIAVHPVQKPHPPIWIGAGLAIRENLAAAPGERMLEVKDFGGPFERVARLGDGWLAGGYCSPDDCRRVLAMLREIAPRFGKTSVPAIAVIPTNVQDRREDARRELKASQERYSGIPYEESVLERFIVGTPDDCIAKIREFIAAGITEFVLIPQTDDVTGQIERLARDVLPHTP